MMRSPEATHNTLEGLHAAYGAARKFFWLYAIADRRKKTVRDRMIGAEQVIHLFAAAVRKEIPR